MKKNLVLCLFALMSVLYCTRTRAQTLYYGLPTFAIHVTSPTGFFYKGGIKAEYRIYSENAFLLGYTHYFGYFPGYQGYLEYRSYFHTKSVAENLVYAKLGNGFADYQSSPFFTSATDINKAPGTYYFGGGGVGRHFNFGIFFMEITAGLKFTYVSRPPAQYNERLFYTLGPGSIPDVHFHFGLQF